MTTLAPRWAIAEFLPLAGTLGAAETDLYEVPQMRMARVDTLALHNSHASNTTIAYIFIHPSGGTSRRILSQSLAPGVTRPLGIRLGMNEGDKIRGYASNAAQVVFAVTRREFYRV